jgi:hypothetical protein
VVPEESSQQKLDVLMEAIDRAMKEVGQRDIAVVKNRLMNETFGVKH